MTAETPSFPPKEQEQKEHASVAIPAYAEVIRDEFNKEFPEHSQAMNAVIEEFSKQVMEKWPAFNSSRYPGVTFNYTKIPVTENLIRDISPNTYPSPENQEKASKKDIQFLFSAFTPPADSHPLAATDMAVNDIIRALPRVANGLKRGETPPQIDIVLVGSPAAPGAQTTEEFYNDVRQKGFEAHGELYAEFIEHMLQDEPSATARLHGVSKGAVVADESYSHLSERLRQRTQVLLDNPAGTHSPRQRFVKGTQVLAGLVGELAVKTLGDTTTKETNKKAKAFREAMEEAQQFPSDSLEQKKQKNRLVLQEGLKLIKGSPLDTEHNRLFIRKGFKDPLTTGITYINQIQDKIRELVEKGYTNPNFVAFDEGKSITVPTEHGTHFYIYKDTIKKKWNNIFTFVKNNPNPAPPQNEAE